MKTFAIVLNAILFAFTLLVVVTDGPPDEAAYVVLTLALLAVPVVSSAQVVRHGSTSADRIIAVCNLLLVAFVGWAIWDRYPHPDEEGFLAFVVVAIAAPLVSAVALLQRRAAAR